MPRALVLLLLSPLALALYPAPASASGGCSNSHRVVCQSGWLTGDLYEFTWLWTMPAPPITGLALQSVYVYGLETRTIYLLDDTLAYDFAPQPEDFPTVLPACDMVGASPWVESEAGVEDFTLTNTGGGSTQVCGFDPGWFYGDAPADLYAAHAEYTWLRTASTAPEPAPLALVATGLLGLVGAGAGRRKRAHA